MPCRNVVPINPHRKFNGKSLAFAREAAGLKQNELASQISVSTTLISLAEAGEKALSDDVIEALCLVLPVTKDFFFEAFVESWNVEDCYFRTKQSVPIREKRRTRSLLPFYSRLIQQLRNFVRLPSLGLPDLSSDDLRDPERAAAVARTHLKLSPDRPIGHICRVVETAGVVIVARSLGPQSIDAVAHVGRNPMILLNLTNSSSSRLVFDVAHEFAHVIYQQFNRELGEELERNMHRFASAFLMPRDSFMRHFGSKPLSIAFLAELKRTWRASMAAILMRAKELGSISDLDLRKWYKIFGAKGWRKTEPYEFSFEVPTLLRQGLSMAGSLGLQKHELAMLCGLKTPFLLELIKESSDQDVEPSLHVL